MRTAFGFRKTVQSLAFVIGEPIQGRTTKKYLINLACPILDDAGRLQGVLTAGLDLTWLGTQLAKSNFPSGTAMGLTDATGKVLYRYPEPLNMSAKCCRTRCSSRPWPPATKGWQRGGDCPAMSASSPLPGYRLLGKSSGWPSVSPAEWAIGKVNLRPVAQPYLVGLGGAFCHGRGWYGGDLFVVRPVRGLRGVTERLAAGDLSVRAGPDYAVGELGLLAHSFDQMADSLRERRRTCAGPKMSWNSGSRCAPWELSAVNEHLLREIEDRQLAQKQVESIGKVVPVAEQGQ